MADGNRNALLILANLLSIFASFGNGAYQECVTSLRNIVVYEGTLNTMLSCTAGPNGSAWSVRPTSRALTPYTITNFDDTVASNFTGLYESNQSGLTVRNATITPTGGPISTAGIYFVKFTGTSNQTAAKLVVIRSGPFCSCDQLAPDAVNITCNIVYADHPVAPILPIVNCTANGQFYATDKPIRILDNPNSTLYVYNSTSTITINNTALTTYQCKVTFSAPTTGAPAYLAKNAPNFSADFTLCDQPTTTEPLFTTTATEPQTTPTSLPLTTSPTSSTPTSSTPTSSTPTSSIPTSSTPTSSTPTSSTPTGSTQSTTVSQQTVSSTEASARKDMLLSVAVILSVVLGGLLITSVVCCCWYWFWWFRRRPSRFRFEVSEPIADDYRCRRGRYFIYRDNFVRPNQLTCHKQPIYIIPK